MISRQAAVRHAEKCLSCPDCGAAAGEPCPGGPGWCCPARLAAAREVLAVAGRAFSAGLANAVR